MTVPNIAPSQGDLFQAEATWFHVFRSMIEAGDIARMGPYAATVYMVVKAHTNYRTGRTFPSIDTISMKSGVSRAQVIRELKTLETFGYVTKTRVGRHNEYRLREKVYIADKDGQPAAVATWDYLPSSIKEATADLKNVLLSGNFAGSQIVRIERLQVNVTHANDNAIVLNIQDLGSLPSNMREMLLSLRSQLERRRSDEVIHSSA
ncbi:hypothetical protein WL57_35995 [Burkholderia cepacia]|uniref:helix-turn-helix domain-containing protein n=1 Tax=Burkholderia cepacia TaxID=292 RepID=UPI0007534E4C|nr:helix-turn-helix domain-containing protein [Burkholderia cepacia]KWC74562.1 hypothetical protein WL57_35995 [Burkholderia cepacia]